MIRRLMIGAAFSVCVTTATSQVCEFDDVRDDILNSTADPDCPDVDGDGVLGPNDLYSLFDKIIERKLDPNYCTAGAGVITYDVPDIPFPNLTPGDIDDMKDELENRWDEGGCSNTPDPCLMAGAAEGLKSLIGGTPPTAFPGGGCDNNVDPIVPGDGSPQPTPIYCSGTGGVCDTDQFKPKNCITDCDTSTEHICFGVSCPDLVDLTTLPYPPVIDDLPYDGEKDGDAGQPTVCPPSDSDAPSTFPPSIPDSSCGSGDNIFTPKRDNGDPDRGIPSYDEDPDPTTGLIAIAPSPPSGGGGGGDTDDGEGGKGDCGGSSSSEPGGGSQGVSSDPVNLATGHKVHAEVDVSVAVTGGNYTITRTYNSDPNFPNSGLVGNNWSLSVFSFLHLDSTNDDLYQFGPRPDSYTKFEQNGTGQWLAGGPGRQLITETSLNLDGSGAEDLYAIDTPGAGSSYYSRRTDFMEGLLRATDDVSGNRILYEYDQFGGNGTDASARLRKIVIHQRGSDNPEAEIEFQWYAIGGTGHTFVNTRLARIFVFRYDVQSNATDTRTETQRIEYVYMADDGDSFTSLHDDLGSEGDLIMVNKIRRVDSSETDPVRAPTYPSVKRFTQYRYHRTGEFSSGYIMDDERMDVEGLDSQLKMVIRPQQIEYGAERLNQNKVLDDPADAVMDFAYRMLMKGDYGYAFVDRDASSTQIRVADLAQKIIGYETTAGDDYGRVRTQYLQTSCGCAGGAEGLKQAYTYLEWDDTTNSSEGISTKVIETSWNGSTFATGRKTTYTDSEYLDEVPYIIHHVIDDDTTTSRQWVTSWEYDSDHNVTHKYTPAAHHETTPYTEATTSTRPTVSRNSNEGLAYFYTYTADNRLKELGVQAGTGSMKEELIWRRTYGNSATSGERDYLIKKVERFNYGHETGSVTADQTETTYYTYGFHSGDSIAWIRSMREAPKESENGPTSTDRSTSGSSDFGGTEVFDHYQLFDTQGRHVWTRRGDWSVTEFTFDWRTGRYATITSNLTDTDLPVSSNFASVPTTYWGEDPRTGVDHIGGELEYTLTRDLLGRRHDITTPTGVTIRTRTEYRYTDLVYGSDDGDIEHPGIHYLAQVTYPMWLDDTDTFIAPVSVRWYDIAGDAFAAVSLRYDETSDPFTGTLTLDDAPWDSHDEILGRSTSIRSYSGLVSETSRWARVSDTDVSVGREVTEFTYDAIGRLKTTTDPGETVTEIDAYDVLDRPVSIKAGLISDMVQVAEYFYDDPDTDGNTEQGVGNGVVSWTVAHVDLSTVRETFITYDDRDRAVVIKNPHVPHTAIAYDNLDRPVTQAVYSTVPTGTTSTTGRGLLRHTRYDQSGFAFAQDTAIDPSQTSPDYLRSSVWRDGIGRTIASWSVNDNRSKVFFDGHGRPVTIFATDGRNDPSSGANASWASARSVSDDRIIEQTEYEYRTTSTLTGVTDLVTHRMRLDDDSTTYGELGDGDSIVTYSGYEYDDAARPIASVEFGTNKTAFASDTSSQAPTTPITAGTPGAGTEITSLFEYNERGLVGQLTDPLDRDTGFVFDSLNRRIATIENMVGTVTLSWDDTLGYYEVDQSMTGDDDDENRVTSQVFDAAGNMIKMVAHNKQGSTDATKAQVTKYHYGTDTPASEIASNNLLDRVEYPDSGIVELEYNRLGELIKRTDQNGNLHTYTRDDLGRAVQDVVTFASGTDIDNTVKEISYTFDSLGRLTDVLSLDGSTVINAVEFEYTPLWRLEHFHQNHSDSTREATTPFNLRDDTQTVTYSYDENAYDAVSEPNRSLVDTVTYPADQGIGSTVTVKRGPSNSPDHARAYGYKITDFAHTSSTNLVEYDFIGMSALAELDLPIPDVKLDRRVKHNGETVSETYDAYDRFGRLKHQRWVDGDFDEHLTDTSVPAIPSIVEIDYTFDHASNILTRGDSRPGKLRPIDTNGGGLDPADDFFPGEDFEYSYDGLDRLTEALRGADTSGGFEHALVGSKQWDLDPLGNWTGHDTDMTGDGDFVDTADDTETRTHNPVNELLTTDGDVGDLDNTYDDAGNFVNRELTAGSTTIETVYIYDAWNRLVTAHPAGAPLTPYGEYTYNGLHYRVTSDASALHGGKRSYYYNADWQMVEEHVDTDEDSDLDRLSQYFWGLRYIDELIAKRIDRDPSRTTPVDADDRWDSDTGEFFFLNDHQFSVVATLRSDSSLHSRVSYDAYGTASYRADGDLNQDGIDWDADDLFEIFLGTNGLIGSAAYMAESDIDRDGEVDFDDMTVFGNSPGEASALPGRVTVPADDDGPDCNVGYAGYFHMPELNTYSVRYRVYDPSLGRWFQRDPAGYVDGASLYEYVAGGATFYVDPYGLSFWGTVTDILSGGGARTDEIQRLRDRNCKKLEQARKQGKVCGKKYKRLKRNQRCGKSVAGEIGSAAGKAAGDSIKESLTDPHVLLEGVGLIPAIGIVADLANAGLYAMEGDVENAGWSALAAVPVIGYLGNAGKSARRASRWYPVDRATRNTVNRGADMASEGEARALARRKIGHDPVEVAPHKLRSQDGRWQYRAKPGDLNDNHVHLERIDPKTGEVLENWHLYFPPRTRR